MRSWTQIAARELYLLSQCKAPEYFAFTQQKGLQYLQAFGHYR
jgi:hypothetical protein